MLLAPQDFPTPITINADGVALVGGTRVSLDVVILAFKQGATPEEIMQQYPVLELPDIYAVIAYYLQARSEVDAYLKERQLGAEQVKAENEARFDPMGIRERLLARRNQ